MSHVHLSGWKHAGAYRVIVVGAGERGSFVFKDADYRSGQFDALDGLSLTPGPPEHGVLVTARGLGRWTPRCLWSLAEPDAGRYRYLLEDLVPQFGRSPCRAARRSFVEALPRLHSDLEVALRHEPTLLDYDGPVHDEVVRYALEGLSMARDAGLTPPHPLSDRWADLESWAQRSAEEIVPEMPRTVVHGDLNSANVLWHHQHAGVVRLLDWEWAGWGMPHHDLASFLKHTDPAKERAAVRTFALRCPSNTPAQHAQAYYWSKLQRALMDSGFFLRQLLGSGTADGFDSAAHIRRALDRARSALGDLDRG